MRFVMISRRAFAVLGILWMLGAVAGCGTPDARSDDAGHASRLRLEIDKADPERLVRYYFGGYASREGSDPFEAGLVTREDGALWLDVDRLDETLPGTRQALEAAGRDGTLDWDDLEAFFLETYYDARPVPRTVESLRDSVSYFTEPDAWFTVEVDGVMTTARRRIHVQKAALRSALAGYHDRDEQLIYPVGTTIVGEHLEEGQLRETTAMRKREDGLWDFVTYGPDGALAAKTQTPPRPLKSPTQCVGCHFGSKQFEPERSFPGTAAPGPHGPRAVYVDEALRDGEVVSFFREHTKRSDTVLGLYNTLFVAGLRADRAAGTISDADARLLDELGL